MISFCGGLWRETPVISRSSSSGMAVVVGVAEPVPERWGVAASLLGAAFGVFGGALEVGFVFFGAMVEVPVVLVVAVVVGVFVVLVLVVAVRFGRLGQAGTLVCWGRKALGWGYGNLVGSHWVLERAVAWRGEWARTKGGATDYDAEKKGCAFAAVVPARRDSLKVQKGEVRGCNCCCGKEGLRVASARLHGFTASLLDTNCALVSSLGGRRGEERRGVERRGEEVRR